jgi:hypothetical protein
LSARLMEFGAATPRLDAGAPSRDRRTPRRLAPASGKFEQELGRVEPKARETSDHCAIEANELQIPSDIDLDQFHQLIHVPGLDLIGDES